MKTIYLDQLAGPQPPCVATVGFFDGVHRGHQFLLAHVCADAASRQLPAMAITFDRQPREVLTGTCQPLLSPLDEKLQLLSQTGIDSCVVLAFTPQLAALSARDFMAQVLRQLGVCRLHIGYDNRFGHNRSEGFDDYVRHGRELGIDVVQSQPFSMEGVGVSSSLVRDCVAQGRMEQATRYLGRPYMLRGRVVDGFHEGRRLGFPTANMELGDDRKLLPAPGVYAVRVRTEQADGLLPGMMNIGTRPTYGANNQQTLEVHILHFSANLYGQQLEVHFESKLRDEQRFDSREALCQQLCADAARVAQQLEKQSD